MTQFHRLTPFKRCVLQNFPFIEEDFDALTNYGLLCKIVEYLNNVIKVQNEVSEQTENLTEAFNNLKEYIDNYFENLDVQEEINNKLDEMTEAGTIADIIAGYIQLRGILAYDTVASMKSATNLVNGSFAETYGFYAKGDGGSAKYKVREITNADVVDEMTIIALADESLVAEFIPEINEISPLQFGAKGDGETDDSSILNACFLYAYDNNLKVSVPNKVYAIAQPLIVYTGTDDTNKGISIIGDDRGRPVFKAIEAIENMVSIKKRDTGSECHNVIISNIQLNGNEICDNGIYISQGLVSSVLDRIYIRKIIKNGITSVTGSNTYLSVLRQIRVDYGEIGINLQHGINTSLHIEDCYVYHTTVAAYFISAIYSTMTACAADSCTGYVYEIGGTIKLQSCGSESPNASEVFHILGGAYNSSVIIDNAFTFGNFTDSTAKHIHLDGGAYCTITNSRLLLTTSGSIDDETGVPGYLIYLANASRLIFDGNVYSKYALSNPQHERPAYFREDNHEGSVSVLNSGLVAYLGVNGYDRSGKLDYKSGESHIDVNAIYMGMSSDYKVTSSGTELRWHKQTMKGDIILSQEPKAIGGIGWIQNKNPETSASTWINGELFKIPVILSGHTSDRPTVALTVGQMYFDTDLGKPIWCKSTSGTWVDATGATV